MKDWVAQWGVRGEGSSKGGAKLSRLGNQEDGDTMNWAREGEGRSRLRKARLWVQRGHVKFEVPGKMHVDGDAG